MNLNQTLIGAAVAAAFMSALPAQAQTAKDFDEMRQEIKRLRDEVNALKQQAAPAKAANTSGWGERIEQLQIFNKREFVDSFFSLSETL